MSLKNSVDLNRLFAGERAMVARAISVVENGDETEESLLRGIATRTGRAYRLGITGPPGAGKSTLVNRLARHYRTGGLRVGIIAVDPTSPFTGGALLGDRVRMSELELDTGVFIRSMASRGSLGGLSRKASEVADLLDAAGNEMIMLETVGVGQSELDIAHAADSTIVVLVPESGDSIQAMKAGLMEIADMIIVNKADRAGAEQAVSAIHMVLQLRAHTSWIPPVATSVASEGKGIAEIAELIGDHRAHLEKTGALAARRKSRLRRRIMDLVADRLKVDFWTTEREAILRDGIETVIGGRTSLYDTADRLVDHFHSH
jgi:LAO/AO transport system kinase